MAGFGKRARVEDILELRGRPDPEGDAFIDNAARKAGFNQKDIDFLNEGKRRSRKRYRRKRQQFDKRFGGLKKRGIREQCL